MTTLHQDFKIWAEDNSINLEHEDDYKMWYKCWANGFNSSLRLYSVWKDGTQWIGSPEKDVRNLYIKEGF